MKNLTPILILFIGLLTISCSNNGNRIPPYPPCLPGQYCPPTNPAGSLVGQLQVTDRAVFGDYLKRYGACGVLRSCKRVSELSRVTVHHGARSTVKVTIEGFGDSWNGNILHSANTSFTARTELIENGAGFGWISHGDFGYPYPPTRIIARKNKPTDTSINVAVDFEGRPMLSGTLRTL